MKIMVYSLTTGSFSVNFDDFNIKSVFSGGLTYNGTVHFKWIDNFTSNGPCSVVNDCQ